jgi:hypothetical protein
MHRNVFPFSVICAILFVALIIGFVRNRPAVPEPERQEEAIAVPYIGRVQVLNGCGIDDAANKVRDYLRKKNFDVKNTGNAPSFNYEFTMVVSRTQDMTVARQVARALGVKSDRCILERTADSTYNVTVIIGPDYGEKIK